MIRYIPNQKVIKRKKEIKMLNEKGVELLKQVIQKKYNNISYILMKMSFIMNLKLMNK